MCRRARRRRPGRRLPSEVALADHLALRGCGHDLGRALMENAVENVPRLVVEQLEQAFVDRRERDLAIGGRLAIGCRALRSLRA